MDLYEAVQREVPLAGVINGGHCGVQEPLGQLASPLATPVCEVIDLDAAGPALDPLGGGLHHLLVHQVREGDGDVAAAYSNNTGDALLGQCLWPHAAGYLAPVVQKVQDDPVLDGHPGIHQSHGRSHRYSVSSLVPDR